MRRGGGWRFSWWLVSLLMLLVAPPSTDREATPFRWRSGAAWVSCAQEVLHPHAGVGLDTVVVAPPTVSEAWAQASLTAGANLRIAPGSVVKVRGLEVSLLYGSLEWESQRPIGGLWVGEERFVIQGCALVELNDPFTVLVFDGHLHVNGRRFDRGMALRGSSGWAPEQRPFPRRWRRPAAVPAQGRLAPGIATLPHLVTDRRRSIRERRQTLFSLEDLGAATALAGLASARLEEVLEAYRRSAVNEGLPTRGSDISRWQAYLARRAAQAATEDRHGRREGRPKGIGEVARANLDCSPAVDISLEEQLTRLQESDRAVANFVLSAVRDGPRGRERAYFLAYVIELVGSEILPEILSSLSVAETLMLQSALAPVLFSEQPEVRAKAEALYVRAGLFVPPADPSTLPGFPIGATEALDLRLVAEALARPLDPCHAAQLEAWAGVGWTRFHLESLLGLPRMKSWPGEPRDLNADRGGAPPHWAGLGEDIRSYQASRVQRRHRFGEGVLAQLDSGGDLPRALYRYRPDWRLLKQILVRLDEVGDQQAQAWEPLLFSWIGSAPPGSLVSEMGMASALRLHLMTILPMYQDPGEGLFPP
ncbi:MAG TPA: hypothetical protein PKA37_08825 [Planctomycetota bacterium]|nr:hypothetical protein [Planctomycetota bacterium]